MFEAYFNLYPFDFLTPAKHARKRVFDTCLAPTLKCVYMNDFSRLADFWSCIVSSWWKICCVFYFSFHVHFLNKKRGETFFQIGTGYRQGMGAIYIYLLRKYIYKTGAKSGADILQSIFNRLCRFWFLTPGNCYFCQFSFLPVWIHRPKTQKRNKIK